MCSISRNSVATYTKSAKHPTDEGIYLIPIFCRANSKILLKLIFHIRGKILIKITITSSTFTTQIFTEKFNWKIGLNADENDDRE